MHSATANDYMPNGPLLLARTHLRLHALPQPVCRSVLRNIPVGQEVPLKQELRGTRPLCREMPPPQSTRALLRGRKVRVRARAVAVVVAAAGGELPCSPLPGDYCTTPSWVQKNSS